MGPPLPASQGYGGEPVINPAFLYIAALFLPLLRGADLPTPRPLTQREFDALEMHCDPDRTINSYRRQTISPVPPETKQSIQMRLPQKLAGRSGADADFEPSQKVRTMSLYASLIALLGLWSSILSGNEDGFIMHVPVVQQKALLVFASALAVRALCIRICDFSFRRRRLQAIGTPVCLRTRSLIQPGERSRPNRPRAESIASSRPGRRRTERGIWLWTESVVI